MYCRSKCVGGDGDSEREKLSLAGNDALFITFPCVCVSFDSDEIPTSCVFPYILE